MNFNLSQSLQERQIINSNCEKALLDFPFHDHVSTWIEDYISLFNSIKLESIEENSNSTETETSVSFTTKFYKKFNKLLS